MAIGGAFVGRNPETRAFLLLVDQKALVETHNQSKTNKLPLQRRGMEIMFSAEALEDGKTIEFYLDEIGTRYADDDVMYVMTSPSHIPVKLSTVKVLL